MRTIQERMAEIKATQEAGTYTRCPRCGEHTMKLGDRLYTNALSRSYDIMICDLFRTWCVSFRAMRPVDLGAMAPATPFGVSACAGGHRQAGLCVH